MGVRRAAGIAVLLIALTLALAASASAQTHRAPTLPAGGAVTTQAAYGQLIHERRVWMWADYWVCVFDRAPDGTLVPRCMWIPSHFQWVSTGDECHGQVIGNGTVETDITVCLPRTRNPAVARGTVRRVDFPRRWEPSRPAGDASRPNATRYTKRAQTGRSSSSAGTSSSSVGSRPGAPKSRTPSAGCSATRTAAGSASPVRAG